MYYAEINPLVAHTACSALDAFPYRPELLFCWTSTPASVNLAGANTNQTIQMVFAYTNDFMAVQLFQAGIHVDNR
jgi:hypothetical protein